jgi:hypothetical protein
MIKPRPALFKWRQNAPIPCTSSSQLVAWWVRHHLVAIRGLPVGFRWAPNGRVEIDPDRRVQDAVHLVFTKMVELGSARQVLLWFRGENTNLPALVLETPGHDVAWKLPVYNTIWHMLRNPMYAGTYAFGKTESRPRSSMDAPERARGISSRVTHGWS